MQQFVALKAEVKPNGARRSLNWEPRGLGVAEIGWLMGLRRTYRVRPSCLEAVIFTAACYQRGGIRLQ